MSVFDERMVKQTKMLTIENERKLLGTKLTGSGSAGPMEWVVTSIKPHLNHYVIFIEQKDIRASVYSKEQILQIDLMLNFLFRFIVILFILLNHMVLEHLFWAFMLMNVILKLQKKKM